MLTHRQLTHSEAVLLHEELKTTPNILGYTVVELTRFNDVFVADVDSAFAGACISKDLHFGWTDIAVLYVLPAFRGQGLARQLYTAAWRQAMERERHIFTLSRSPEVIHLMKDFGMEVTSSMMKAPFAVHWHMNCHMSSVYRIKEAIRKSRQMKTAMALHSGTKRHNPQNKGMA